MHQYTPIFNGFLLLKNESLRVAHKRQYIGANANPRRPDFEPDFRGLAKGHDISLQMQVS